MQDIFSNRNKYNAQEIEITVREDAPVDLRNAIVILWKRQLPNEYKKLREIVCNRLVKQENVDNWSDTPVIQETQELLNSCEWFYVYDIIEDLANYIEGNYKTKYDNFESDINSFFKTKGIGWQLLKTKIQIRGNLQFERIVSKAVETLDNAQKKTTSSELSKAMDCLSKRPNIDNTGAIQHAGAALECLCRELSHQDKDKNLTLGAWVKSYKKKYQFNTLIADIIDKVWGYLSNNGRHLKEGNEPNFEDAQLIVGLSASLVTYLTEKHLLNK